MSVENEPKEVNPVVSAPSPGLPSPLWFLPMVAIWAWWVYDLHFQWNALPEYKFGWMVIFMVAFLVWDKWDARPKEDVPEPMWKVVGLTAIGSVFVLFAELYKSGIANTPSTSFALSIGCILFIRAMVIYGWGLRTWRHFRFAVLFLLVAVPLPSIIYQKIVLELKEFVTLLNVDILKLIGIPAKQMANVIQLPNCEVGVDEACSGVRSLQSSIMAALFIGYTMLQHRSAKIFLLVAGVVLAIFGNLCRSLLLSITAYKKGTAALENLHDTAGFGVLALTAVGLVGLSFLAARLEKAAAERRKPAPTSTNAST